MDLVKAQKDAEEAREARKAEAIVAHRLFEKERLAKAAVSVARKRARASQRLARADREFEETRRELEEAEKRRQKRIEDRQRMHERKAPPPQEEVVPAAEKEKRRSRYILEAAARADAAEAARAAAQAQRALKKMKNVAPQSSLEVVVGPPSTSTADRRQRRDLLEALAAQARARCTVEGLRAMVSRAVALGLGDDCPELLEARLKEHALAADKARAVIETTGREHAYAKEQHETLVSQGYNRAADRARRTMDDKWRKNLEAKGALQYHEARHDEARRSLERERDRRETRELPPTMLLEDRAARREDYDETKKTEPPGRRRAAKPPRVRPAQVLVAAPEAEEKKRQLIEALRSHREARADAQRSEAARHLEAQQEARARAREVAGLDKARRTAEAREIAQRADAAKAATAAAKATAREAARFRKELEAASSSSSRAKLEYEARKHRAAADAARHAVDDLQKRREELVADRERGRAKDLSSIVFDAVARARDAIQPPPEEEETPEVFSRLALHFRHPSSAALNMSLELQIPPNWNRKPSRKLIDVFAKNYVARRKGSLVSPESLKLTTLTGTCVARETKVLDVLDLGALRVVSP